MSAERVRANCVSVNAHIRDYFRRTFLTLTLAYSCNLHSNVANVIMRVCVTLSEISSASGIRVLVKIDNATDCELWERCHVRPHQTFTPLSAAVELAKQKLLTYYAYLVLPLGFNCFLILMIYFRVDDLLFYVSFFVTTSFLIRSTLFLLEAGNKCTRDS